MIRLVIARLFLGGSRVLLGIPDTILAAVRIASVIHGRVNVLETEKTLAYQRPRGVA